MGFIEQAKQIDEQSKRRGGKGFHWRDLWYRALKYLTPRELDNLSVIDVFEIVGQREKRDSELLQALRESLAEPRPTQPAGSEPGAKPAEPRQDSSLDQWFDWYHECKRTGYKVTLQDIAAKRGYSHSYVKQRHSSYLTESNQTPNQNEP